MHINIKDIAFIINCDNEIKPYFINRIKVLDKTNLSSKDKTIKVNIIPSKKVIFRDNSFHNRISPKISSAGIYYEMHGYGIFKFDKEKTEITVIYAELEKQKNKENFFRNIVTGTLQIINLSTLFFNLLPLHAATVKKDGYGIIILGNSTHGKSTTEYLLLHSNFDFFADDIIFLDEFGFIHNNCEKLVSIRNGTIELSNQLFGEILPPKEPDEEKLFLTIENSDFSEKLIPKIILFPEQRNEPNDKKPYLIEKIDKSDLYIELIKNTISSEFPADIIKKYISNMKKLCEKVDAYRVIRTTCYKNSHCKKLLEELSKILHEQII